MNEVTRIDIFLGTEEDIQKVQEITAKICRETLEKGIAVSSRKISSK